MANMNLRKINLIREMERKRTEERGGEYGRDEPWEPDHRRKMTYISPYSEPEMRRYPRMGYDGDMPTDRRMGFGERDGYEHEMRRRRSDGTWMNRGGYGGEEEPIRFGGMVAMSGGKDKSHQKMTREMAEEWVESMHGDDPAKPSGGKWTPDQVKPIATKYGVPTEGERFWEFWSVMNAMYSDYYSVAKKYNALNPDFFADLAMAFISDKDAVPNKAAIYYECIAKG
jgi:hypothetical protein